MNPQNEHDPLDVLLAADGDEEMRPGFDTRFRARLAELKAKPEKRRWWLMLALPASLAAAIAVVITVNGKPQTDAAAGLEIAYEYELYEDYDIVKNLPDLEVLELLAAADVPKSDGVPQ